jgi:ribosomal protein L32
VVGSAISFSGTAKRIRQNKEAATTKTVVMNVVECSECGDRFAICHHLTAQDVTLAERQAVWLRDQFVWDHIQEDKHRSSIALPASDGMK